ncbi:MAG: YjbQ family protein [Deltaproteobacteria bacterium]|nr:YjbQ family protein [Deltaproteobacteria bacterium]
MTEHEELTISTRGRQTIEITHEVQQSVARSKIRDGLCHVFVQHTSASLIVCENADPDVQVDLETLFSKLVPDGDPMFVHRAEGPDDMAAHARSVLTHVGLTIPVMGGRLALGTWQGIFLYEHRTHPHRRRVLVTVLG